MAHLQTTGRSEATPRHPAVAVADQPTFRQSSTEAPQLDPHGRSIDRDEHPVRSVLCRVNPAVSRSAGPIMDRNHQPVRPALILALSGLLFGPMLQYMQTLPNSKVKDKLNELVDAPASRSRSPRTGLRQPYGSGSTNGSRSRRAWSGCLSLGSASRSRKLR